MWVGRANGVSGAGLREEGLFWGGGACGCADPMASWGRGSKVPAPQLLVQPHTCGSVAPHLGPCVP